MAALTRMWQGIDDPTRIDRARLELGPAGLTGHGGQVCDAWTLSWSLEVGSDWVTRVIRVAALGPGLSRRIALHRSADDTWDCSSWQEDAADLPAPGLAEASAVTGALDCDLGLCPVTNLMPIRRLRLAGPEAGLEPEEGTEETLLMAWVEVPSLQVVPRRQIYARSSGGRVRYTSFSRDFTGELSVDADGLVIDYPRLAREVRLA